MDKMSCAFTFLGSVSSDDSSLNSVLLTNIWASNEYLMSLHLFSQVWFELIDASVSHNSVKFLGDENTRNHQRIFGCMLYKIFTAFLVFLGFFCRKPQGFLQYFKVQHRHPQHIDQLLSAKH